MRSTGATSSALNYIYKLPIFTKSSGLAHSLLGRLGDCRHRHRCRPAAIPCNPEARRSGPQPTTPSAWAAATPTVPTQWQDPLPEEDENQWFDQSAFAAPVPAWLGGPNQGFGNAGKDAVVGPGRVNFTTSLYKSFAITERARFELRFESFNTFNHFQPNGPEDHLRQQQLRPDHQRMGSSHPGTRRQVRLLKGTDVRAPR